MFFFVFAHKKSCFCVLILFINVMKPSSVAAVAALAVASAAQGALALQPTKVHAATCASTPTEWSIDAPATADPSTPRLDVNLATPSYAGKASPTTPPTYTLTGSLGLPDHPLGVFAFESNGTACGEQTAYVKDGVLGQVVMKFPPCDGGWTPGNAVNATVHVDVWTVLPVIPPLLSTGFEFDLHLNDAQERGGGGAGDGAGAEQLCLKLDLAQPPETGSQKSQDVCLMDDPAKSNPSAYVPGLDLPRALTRCRCHCHCWGAARSLARSLIVIVVIARSLACLLRK